MSYSIALQSTVTSAADTLEICINQSIKDTLKIWSFGKKVYSILTSDNAIQTYKMIWKFAVLVYSIVQVLVDAEVKRCERQQPIALLCAAVEPTVEPTVELVFAYAAAKIVKGEKKRTRRELLALAKEQKLTGYSRMTTEQLDQLL